MCWRYLQCGYKKSRAIIDPAFIEKEPVLIFKFFVVIPAIRQAKWQENSGFDIIGWKVQPSVHLNTLNYSIDVDLYVLGRR